MRLNLNKKNLNYFKIINIIEPNLDYLVYLQINISLILYINYIMFHCKLTNKTEIFTLNYII